MHATDVELDSFLIWTVAVLVAIVAALYSSVGHGGASGYLAILSFTTVAPDEMATTSLILNIIVASISFLFYGRVRYFSLRLTLPFIATSIPAAFVGGMLPVSIIGYQLLLALILVFAAVRLFSIRNGLPEGA